MKKKITINEMIMNSFGLLESSEQDLFEAKLSSSSHIEKKDVGEINNLAALIAKCIVNSQGERAPSTEVKDKLFEKINSKNKEAEAKNKTGFEFIYAADNDWVPHPEVEGIMVKRLAVNTEKNYLMILMKAAAGTVYPSHHHSGAEECYVLEGDLFVEGKNLGPGDFHHAEGESDHEPLRTKNGCTLLLVVDPNDY